MKRKASIKRKTNETDIDVTLNLDGSGVSKIDTGIGFLDHMVTGLIRHSKMDATLTCKGDLEIDDHHTAEDCALALGSALDEALGDRRGIARFGCAYAPLDEALARAVVDFSGRPFSVVELDLLRDNVGQIACENIVHFIESLATNARATIHVDILRGKNDHHKAEAGFKALALAFCAALKVNGDNIPSTKGVL